MKHAELHLQNGPVVVAVIRRYNMLGFAILKGGRLVRLRQASLVHQPHRRTKRRQIRDTLRRCIVTYRADVLVIEPSLAQSTNIRTDLVKRATPTHVGIVETPLLAARSALNPQGQPGRLADDLSRVAHTHSRIRRHPYVLANSTRVAMTSRSAVVKLMALALGDAVHRYLATTLSHAHPLITSTTGASRTARRLSV